MIKLYENCKIHDSGYCPWEEGQGKGYNWNVLFFKLILCLIYWPSLGHTYVLNTLFLYVIQFMTKNLREWNDEVARITRSRTARNECEKGNDEEEKAILVKRQRSHFVWDAKTYWVLRTWMPLRQKMVFPVFHLPWCSSLATYSP